MKLRFTLSCVALVLLAPAAMAQSRLPGPVVRDHRPGPVVRDHRPAPVVRDHRDSSRSGRTSRCPGQHHNNGNPAACRDHRG